MNFWLCDIKKMRTKNKNKKMESNLQRKTTLWK